MMMEDIFVCKVRPGYRIYDKNDAREKKAVLLGYYTDENGEKLFDIKLICEDEEEIFHWFEAWQAVVNAIPLVVSRTVQNHTKRNMWRNPFNRFSQLPRDVFYYPKN